MSNIKVAVVTGSNKGIGLEITRSIAKKFDGVVYLTCNHYFFYYLDEFIRFQLIYQQPEIFNLA